LVDGKSLPPLKIVVAGAGNPPADVLISER
jgi:hypothetical protein